MSLQIDYRYIHGNNIIYNGEEIIRFYLVIILINLITAQFLLWKEVISNFVIISV